MKRYFITIVFVITSGVFMFSCSNNSDNAVGPSINNSYLSWGTTAIVKMNWIDDFDGVTAANGLFPSSIVPDANTESVVTVSYPSNGSNHYADCNYQIKAQSGGGEPWARFYIQWGGGLISTYDYGNAVYFKAKLVSGSSKIRVVLPHIILNDNDYDVFGAYVTLTSTWRTYVVQFVDMENAGYGERTLDYALTHNRSIGFDPPLDIGAQGEFCIDDISFVYYEEKR